MYKNNPDEEGEKKTKHLRRIPGVSHVQNEVTIVLKASKILRAGRLDELTRVQLLILEQSVGACHCKNSCQ